MQDIKTFNENLVESNSDIPIIDYITKVNDLFYHIEIDFMEDFIDFVDNDNFCINHNLLEKYGVINLECGSSKVKRFLEQHNYVEDRDFRVSQTGDRINYVLKPEHF